jgi:hypothetical protein
MIWTEYSQICVQIESFLKTQSLFGTCNFKTVIYTINFFKCFVLKIEINMLSMKNGVAWYLKLTAEG